MFPPSNFILIANIITVILLLRTIITIIIIIGPGTVTAGNQCSSGSTLVVASCPASRCRKHLASKHNNMICYIGSFLEDHPHMVLYMSYFQGGANA